MCAVLKRDVALLRYHEAVLTRFWIWFVTTRLECTFIDCIHVSRYGRIFYLEDNTPQYLQHLPDETPSGFRGLR